MVLTVFDVFKLNQSIENILGQNIKMSFKNGYEILQLKKELDEIEQYTIERLNQVIDNDRLKTNQMTEEERLTYVTIMNSEIDVAKRNIDFDNIKNNDEISLSITDIETLSRFFEEKKPCAIE